MEVAGWLSITVDIDPVAVALGPIAIRWYGLAYILAITVGIWFAKPFAERRGISREQFDETAIVCGIAGFVGGRLYFVVQNDPSKYLADPLRVLEVWRGGMAFFGAIFAVLLALVAISWVRKLPLGSMLDTAAFFAIIGQPIGRLGNVANGDILGPPTDLPWGVIYTHPDSFAPTSTTAYHPAMVYEMIANLVILAILVPLRHRLHHGWFALAYLALYGVSQLVVFIWRSEPVVFAGLRQGQVSGVAVLLAVVAVAAFRLRRSRGSVTGEATPDLPGS